MSGQETSLSSVKSADIGIRHREPLDAGREHEMGLLLYLLLFGGLFLLMMRFGCGAHVMGHGQHGQHGQHGDLGSDSDQTWDETKRLSEASSNAGIIVRDAAHG